MILRLSFIHGLYLIPGWYIVRDLSVESTPGMLAALFSAVILLAVFQIRLRKRINGRTDSLVSDAMSSAADQPEISLEQSFSFVEYRSMNIEVMFSYLRPWLTSLLGLAFLGITVYALILGTDMVRLVLSFLLTLYFLALPWLLFTMRVKRAYSRGAAAMEGQKIVFRKNGIQVNAGESERRITALSDIAVTPGYLLLFTAGSNYIQVRRSLCSDKQQMTILSRAAGMVEPV